MRDTTKPGRSAIGAEHAGIVKEDEDKFNTKISELYGVDGDEAIEIHASYHQERIFAGLERMAAQNGMTKKVLVQKVQNLDLYEMAYQVAKGNLVEAAAVDILFRNLYKMESNGGDNDRYVNFYG